MFPETNDPPPRAPPSGRSGGWRRGQQTVAHIGRAHSQHRWQRHPPPSQHSSDLDDRRRVARRWRMMPPARPPPPGQPAGATAMVRRWRRRRPAAQACPRLAPAPPLTPPSAARPPSTSHPRHQSSQLPSAGGPHHIRCTPTPLSGARFTRGAVCRGGGEDERRQMSALPLSRVVSRSGQALHLVGGHQRGGGPTPPAGSKRRMVPGCGGQQHAGHTVRRITHVGGGGGVCGGREQPRCRRRTHQWGPSLPPVPTGDGGGGGDDDAACAHQTPTPTPARLPPPSTRTHHTHHHPLTKPRASIRTRCCCATADAAAAASSLPAPLAARHAEPQRPLHARQHPTDAPPLARR